jgi:hypothetical protein
MHIPAFPVALRWNPDKDCIDKRPLMGLGGFRSAGRSEKSVRALFKEVRRVDKPVGEGRELGAEEVVGVGLWFGPTERFVLDIDTKNGQHGDDELDALEEQHGKLPDTLRVTTPSGGAHLWFFKWNPAFPPDTKPRITNTTLAPGIDVRGDNGFVVAPGTETPWGSWEWDGPSVFWDQPSSQSRAPEGSITINTGVVPAKIVPEWVTDLLEERTHAADACDAEPTEEIDLDALPPRLQYLLGEKPVAGTRSDRIYHFVCVGLEDGLADETILAALTHFPPAVDKGNVIRHGQRAIGHARANGVAADTGDRDQEAENAIEPPGNSDEEPSGAPEDEDGELILDPPSRPMPVARDFLKEHYAHPDSDPDDPLSLIRAWRSGWWTWQGPKWVEVEDRRVRGRAYRYTEHAQWWKPQPVGGPKLEPWAPTTRKISDLLDALKAIVFLHRDVDQPEWLEPVDMPGAHELVSVANGLLHIHTRELFAHNPRFFNVTAVPFDYDPDAPEPKRWLQFLEELWPEDPDAIAAL